MDIDGIHYECILSLRNKMPTTLGNAARPNPMMSMGRPSPYGNVPYQMSTRPSYNNSSLYQSHSHLSQQPSHSNRDIHPSMYARDAYPPREQPMSYGGQGQYGGRGPMGSVPSYGSGSSMPGRGPYPPTSQQVMQRLQHQSYGTPMREQVGYRNPDSYSDDQYSERGMPVNPPRYSSNQMSSPQQSMYSSVPASLGRYGGHQERGMMSSNSSLPIPPRDSQFSSDRFNSNLQYRSQSNNNYFSSQNEDNFQENRIDSYLHSAQQEFERDLLMPSRPTARSADMLSLDFNTTSASDHSSVFSMPSVFSNNSVNSNTEDHANQFLDHHTAPSSYSIERPAETGKSFHASDFHSLNSDDHTDTMLSSSISSLSLDKA